jgi:hypothetical protein
VLAAGVVAALAGLALPTLPPWLGFLARGATTTAVFAGMLAITGFFRPTERAFLRELRHRVRRRPLTARTSHVD